MHMDKIEVILAKAKETKGIYVYEEELGDRPGGWLAPKGRGMAPLFIKQARRKQ